MPKANLTLVGASLSLNADIVKAELATENQLHEADIDAACRALFEKKETFVLFKGVELAVAANLFGRLQTLGIDSEVEVLSLEDANEKQNTSVFPKVLGALSVLSFAACTGYFFYSQKTSQLAPIVTEQIVQLPKTEKIATDNESTKFHEWRMRLDGIANLKYELDLINSNSRQARMIAMAEDTLIRAVGENYLIQLAIQRHDSGLEDSRITDHHNALEKNIEVISSYPEVLDQFYVTLELATVYREIGELEASRSTFELAKKLSGALNQSADIVIAEVALAEYQHLHGLDQHRNNHLVAAAEAADSGTETGQGILQDWAIAYIAQGEAKIGLFAEAHRRLELISDEQIVRSAMVDILRFASSTSDLELPGIADRHHFVEDNELSIILSNSKDGV